MKKAVVNVNYISDGALAGMIAGFGVNIWNESSKSMDIQLFVDGKVFFTICRAEAEDIVEQINSGVYKI